VYEAHYGFTEKPFNLTPDPKYIYLSARHTEAYAHLEFGRRERGGFVLITGEVGTGKTTLARYFLGHVGDQAATAVVLYPALTAAELLQSILDDLHVVAAGASLKELVDALHAFLVESRAAERNVILLIDEAQDLSPEVLEQVRLISNLETDTEKLIQIILMGQSELREMLARRDLRQLAQRVTARYHLMPLSSEETSEYIRHRLSVAGGEGKVVFTSGALAAIHSLSGGVPRLINLICDRALLGGYVQGTRIIHTALVRRAALEVRGDDRPRRRAIGRYAAIGAVLLVAAAAAVLWALTVAPGVAPAPPAPRAVSASPTPAAPEPSPSPSPEPTDDLEPVLLALNRDASRDGAVAEMQALWRTSALQRTSLRTYMEQVRRLDLPVVLEMFHPARRDTCFLALVALDERTALVASGTGTPLRVALKDLDRLWTRQAIVFWKDSESVVGGDPARAAAWARQVLARLGYESASPDLSGTLARFQRDLQLVPDGVLGSRTVMALYSLGGYPRPRLARGAS
jgi:general secretion pathway protein A